MGADGFVAVQPDSTGKRVDTTEVVLAGVTVERQRIVIIEPPVAAPYRGTTGRILFTEDFADGMSAGMYNDGCGSAHVDHNVRYNGKPSVRLDPQNNSSTGTATGGNQQLTLSGTATYTVGGSGTLVGTTTQAGAPVVRSGLTDQYILLNGTASGGPTADGNSYVLTYTTAVVSGSAGAWTVTFSGVAVMNLPGTVGGANASATTANSGSAVMAVNNPNPNATGSPVTTGVVFKRRLADQFSGKFGNSLWFRPTSKSAATSFTSVFTCSIYNRDGQNYWAARVMIQTAVGMNPGTWNNDNVLLWFVTGTSAAGFLWVPIAFITRAAFNQHTWDPVGGSWDRSGGWHFVKVIADFVNLQYVSIQFNETVYTSMAGRALYQGIGDTGAKMLHFSCELAQAQSATRRFWNVANVVGTQEF